jgi:hypothetical protein
VRIELNCDAGEGDGGGGQDAALIPLVSAVNVACGAHAGGAATIERTLGLAMTAGAFVGAHPSYPDRESFGRRHLDLEPAALEASLIDQVEAVMAAARSAGVALRHVKVHGALYNEAARDAGLAEVVVRAVAQISRAVVVRPRVPAPAGDAAVCPRWPRLRRSRLSQDRTAHAGGAVHRPGAGRHEPWSWQRRDVRDPLPTGHGASHRRRRPRRRRQLARSPADPAADHDPP